MRILLVSPFPPLIGGVSVSTQRLYDNLKCDGYDVDRYNIHPINKILNNHVGLFLCYFWIPFYVLFHKKYDVIHCHVPGTYRKMYLSLSKKLFFKGARLIFTLHGDVNTLLNRFSSKALLEADKLICVQKGDTIKLPPSLKSKSVDIPAFILPKVIKEDGISDKILSFIKDSKIPVILFYGSVVFSNKFQDLYGIKDTIDLIDEIENHNIQVKLLMLLTYKNNSDIDFVINCRNRVHDRNNILLLENANIPMLPLFKYANLYIRPSKTDGDSLAVREALSMNCPVVASNKAKRPYGTFVYSSKEEFVELTIKCLSGSISVPQQPNFYVQIKKVYEF